MKQITIIILILFSYNSFSQVSDAEFEMKNGEKRTISLNLIYFDGGTIFPDSYSDYVYGKENGKNVSINKSEIIKIKVKFGREYFVIKQKGVGMSNFMVGYFITDNNFKLFKRYLHDHRSYGSYSPGMSSGISINKVTTIDYYVVENDQVRRLNKKKDSRKLSENCSKFKEYLSKIGKIQEFEIEDTFIYYDTYCN